MPLTQLNLLCRQLQSQCAATWAGLQSALPALLQDRRTTSLELYTLLCPIAECAPMAVALSPEFEGAFHALAQSVSSVEVSPCVLMQCTRASHVPCMLVLIDGRLPPAYPCSTSCCCSLPLVRRAQRPCWLQATRCGKHLTRSKLRSSSRQAHYLGFGTARCWLRRLHGR